MKKSPPAFIALTLITVIGCSNQQLYDAIQKNHIEDCRKLQGAQYETCIARYEKSYDSYEHERKETLKK